MKQRKKRWAWTEAQIRKQIPGSMNRRTAPTWYCKLISKTNKTKTKSSLHKVILGYDLDFLEFGNTSHKHNATWLWY